MYVALSFELRAHEWQNRAELVRVSLRGPGWRQPGPEAARTGHMGSSLCAYRSRISRRRWPRSAGCAYPPSWHSRRPKSCHQVVTSSALEHLHGRAKSRCSLHASGCGASRCPSRPHPRPRSTSCTSARARGCPLSGRQRLASSRRPPKLITSWRGDFVMCTRSLSRLHGVVWQGRTLDTAAHRASNDFAQPKLGYVSAVTTS